MNLLTLAQVARITLVAACRLLPTGTDDNLGPVDQDPDEVRDDACRILSGDPSVCEPAETLPPRTPEGGGGLALDLFSLILWVVLIAAVAFLVYVVVRAAMKRSGITKRRRSGTDDGIDDGTEGDAVERDVVAIDRGREPIDWRAEAEAHRRAGRYRDALRCRYRALVGDLARRGLIDEIPGRTTGEERTQLGSIRPQVALPFNDAADLFDSAWYGHVAVGEGDVDRFQVLEGDVLTDAGDLR